MSKDTTMPEVKHTPGEWGVARSSLYAGPGLNVLGRGGAYVCLVGEFGDERAVADAILIAAAPDLLAALKTCLCPGGGWNGMPEDTDPTIENCMAAGACGCDCGAAIAKATGAAS